MKKIFLLLLCLFTFATNVAKEGPKISLLTFDTGFESYSIFGHTAIRVQNPEKNQDIVYNYGIFDFDTPFFLFKFAQGKLQYKVGIQDFELMLRSYQRDQRQITEQPLNLTNAQANKFLDNLEFAFRPENRYYLYGFLQQNCSTKLRELIFEKTENVSYEPTETEKTYRYYLKNYTKPTPWFRFGINLALGSPIDKKIDTYDLMFLPDYLSEEVEKVTVNDKPITTSSTKLLKNIVKKEPNKWTLTPFILFCLLFIAMVLGKSKVLIQSFTFLAGIGGLIILALTFTSAHYEVQNNYNLLWCNPLYLVNFGLCFTSLKKFHRIFAILMILCLLATLGIWYTGIQGYDIGFFPIVISLLWINIKQAQRA